MRDVMSMKKRPSIKLAAFLCREITLRKFFPSRSPRLRPQSVP